MKNKREKKKMSSSGKALVLFLCFVLTIFFIALKGFSHSSREESRLELTSPGIPVPGGSHSRHMDRLEIKERLQAIEKAGKSGEHSLGTISSGTLPEVGSWGYGSCYASFVQNNLLYVGSGRVIDILDVTQPSSPQKLGSVALKGCISSIFVEGNYACAAMFQKGMQVVDISDPGSPTAMGTIDTPGYAWEVFVKNSYAYVADDDQGLRIIDISTPSAPTQVGFLDTPGDAWGIHVAGNYAYVADYTAGLRIIDVTNPANPIEVSFLDTPGYAESVDVSGNYAYVADCSGGLRIIDVSVPTAPVQAGVEYGNTHTVDVSGNYAYTDLSMGWFQIIDISNPSSPFQVSEMDDVSSVRDITVSGDYAYVADGDAGLRIIDVSDPSQPVEILFRDYPNQMKSVHVSGSYAYCIGHYDGLRIIDISNPANPTQVAYMNNPTQGKDVFVSGNYAYLMDASGDFYIIDVSNPYAPVEIGSWEAPTGGEAIYVVGNYAYLCTFNMGLRIVDVSNPASPVEVGYFITPGFNGDVHVAGSYAYVANWDKGLIIIDISNPASPVQKSSMSLSNGRGIFVDGTGSYAYLSCGTSTKIIDVQDPGNPSVLSTTYFGNYRTFVQGTYAFGLNGGSALSVYDVSNPASPVYIDSTLELPNPWSIYITNGYAYITNEEAGLSIVDVSDYTSFIRVTSPNGGEYWETGTNRVIAWNSSGITGNVSIDYSTDSGTNWWEITNSTENDGTYTWTIPQESSENCLVRVSNTAGTLWDQTDTVFTIAAPRTITLTAPNGTENWEGGTAQNITWNHTGIIDEVEIEYSTNNGSTWETIIASTANSGTYNWTVPNTPSGTCLVKVSDLASPAEDTSDAVFTIAEQRTLTVTAPNGGESWEGSTTHDITWTSTGSISNVMIEYSTNNGSTWETITASTANNGTYNWTVPNTPSTNCLVKISDTAGPASDTGDAVFTIVEQRTLTVTAPNGGENWEGTTAHDITWTNTGSIANVMIEYSTNNGSTWNTITASTANSGTYNWTVPNTPSTTCLVKISDTAGPAVDTSDAVFTIAAQRTITVTAPNGGENWEGTTSQNITWTNTGSIANVMIEYSTNNGSTWNTITASTANSGIYNWTVPNTPSTTCLVKISDTAGPATDTSDAVFTIAAQRTLTVTAPNGGENWEGTTSQNITWTSTGSIANVKLEYSTNNGSSWNTITASTANSGTYNWTVPNTPSTNCLVKISDTAGPAADTSDTVFTIAAQRTLTVTAPNGGENWEGTTSQNITWTSTGSIANVKLEYSTNNGSTWNTITASTANSGAYNWTVSNTPSTNCLVKISDTAGPASDTSDAVFTIAAQRTLTVTTPNGGENWEGTTAQNITWTSTGSIANVKLEYSTNNGSSWNTITASTANSGTYNWTVSNTPSTNCLVKISDTVGPASDTSNGVFTIAELRTVTVNSPNGGERWFIDSTYPITWVTTGSIANVMIEYSTNNGSSWDTVISSTGNSGVYNWTIPNTPATNCLVRVSDTAGPAADTSNSVFTIDPYPTITVSAPNGGETWEAYTTQTITWSFTGTVTNVSIDYSTNGGSSWNAITGSTPNTGSFNWTIPYIESNNCLVRVSDLTTTASDTSNGVFTIVLPPSITVTSPNGGESWRRRSTQTITWTSTGNVGDVDIRYSIDGGSTWNLIVSSVPNSGSYQWSLPNVSKTKTQCLVKITAINGSAEDTSDAFFTILK